MRLPLLLLFVVVMLQGCRANPPDFEGDYSTGDADVAGTTGKADYFSAEENDPPDAEEEENGDPATKETDTLFACAREPFVSVWRIPPAGRKITLPIVAMQRGFLFSDRWSWGTHPDYVHDSSFDFTVDWGDGSAEERFSHDGDAENPDMSVEHTYGGTGETKDYEVTIRGRIGLAWGYIKYLYPDAEVDAETADSLVEVKDLGDVEWTSLYAAFSKFPRLEKFAGGCTRNVINMARMFEYSPKVTPDTSGLDTSLVRYVYRMFYDAESANPDVSNWHFSNLASAGGDLGKRGGSPRYSYSSYLEYGMFSPKNSLSTENYSTLLKGLTRPSFGGGLRINFIGGILNVGTEVKYNADAQSARDHLVDKHKFTIVDGGQAP